MDSRRSHCSPVLLIALVPFLLGGLPCSASEPGIGEAPTRSDAWATPVCTSAAPTNGGPASVQDQIARREYRASANRIGLQAPNRVHNLRTYFAPTGIRVHDRTRAGSPELLSLNLAGVGRGEELIRVGPGEVTSDGARVEIERPGLVEWYENSPAGLEQGVTLTKRPGGKGPLIVEFLVNGARASLRGAQVHFATPTGRQLSYAKLAALDARGRALDAHFELPEDSRLQLVVDDDEAVYPVVIDPLLTATADTQFESDQISANLGTSVAGAGDINGDGYADVIVGASGYDAGENNEGAAFIFLGGAAGIADGNPANAATQIESNQPNALLGSSVAGAGDINGDGYDDVIIGAYLYDASQTDGGAAFVFLGSAAGIADGDPSTADALLESDQDGASMGSSVASAGDVDDDGYADVIVGAYRYDTGLANQQCTAISGGQAGFNPFLCCTGPGTGTCVDEGAAFVFRGSATGIASGTSADADTALMSDNEASWLGWSVAGAGDINGDGYDDVITGAMAWDSIRPSRVPFANWGAAFIFLGSAAGIPDSSSADAATQIVSRQTNALLGNSVASAGDVNGDGYADVIVGAYSWTINIPFPLPAVLLENVGRAFIYHGSAAGIPDGDPSTATTTIVTDQAGAALGRSVAGAGDIGGDGYDDVIVGADRWDANGEDEGVAFVFRGRAAGIPDGDVSTAAIQLELGQANAWLGWSVAGAGDVNDDGFDDVIVGAPHYDAPTSSEGAAFVYLGEDMPAIPTPEPAFGIGIAAGVACLAILARRRRRPGRAT